MTRILSALILLFTFFASVLPADEAVKFSGKGKVTKIEELESYTGMKAVDSIEGEWRKKAFTLNHEQLAANYGNNVEFQLREKQIILCPQTEDFLYETMIPKPTYEKGSRPILEKAVGKAIARSRTTQQKALAIMRFCRDLKKKAGRGKDFLYGGTEEELIDKGEDLCETLGRLYVALAEIAGIPARIIMHDIGGHITAEAYIDGHWGYIDPRFGLYFLKDDGSLASLRELVQDRSIIHKQSLSVRKEVRGSLGWKERAAKCEKMYFADKEVNGFQYYSLADSSRYNYKKVSRKEIVDCGLFKINKVYRAVLMHVFGFENNVTDYFWKPGKLERIPVNCRNDGFSPWYAMRPPATFEKVDAEMSPLKNSDIKTIIWGVGPGSVFCFNTSVGELFGYKNTEEEWEKMFRTGDRYVYDNITGLIKRGINPYDLVVKSGHDNGLEIFGRLEMNHEYGPPKDSNWMWHGFVGELNKKHPEYRIKPGVYLDYKFPEVRKFKLDILREVAMRGVDGIELDFCVYPPFFAKPNHKIMTGFVRRVRKMLDEVGRLKGRRLKLQASLIARAAYKDGLNWQTWMSEKLVDRIVPAMVPFGEDKAEFSVRLEKFVKAGKEYDVEVYGRCFQSLCIHSRDPHPKDKNTGKSYYTKPKTIGHYRAQALMHMRTGADGLQLAMGGITRNKKQLEAFRNLGTPSVIEFADKKYLADPFPGVPLITTKNDSGSTDRLVLLRVADDIAEAKKLGRSVKATIGFNIRSMTENEKLEIYINGNGPLTISGSKTGTMEQVIASPSDAQLHTPDWWRKGEKSIDFNPDWLWMGENIIRFAFRPGKSGNFQDFRILYPEITLEYTDK